MKKLMIAAAIVCAAAFAQAATVSWNSGSLMTAADATGGWSSTTIRGNYAGSTEAGWALSVTAYLINEEKYNGLAGKSQADILAATAGLTGKTESAASGTKTSLSVVTDAALGVSQYAILVYNYTDKSGNEFYMAGTATIDGATIQGASVEYPVNSIATGIADWQTVPEPTSGLLLLIGVAGLALRRRRA